MIWRYRIVTRDGTDWAIGVPVRVFLPGCGDIQAVYQFSDGYQRAAVVHFESGGIIAPIDDRHRLVGALEQQAQAAVNSRMALANTPPARVAAVLRSAAKLNAVPEVVGRFSR